ncbi:AIF_collapsed_G0031950.mRNA.1.CDS.1 [Saccharomyces cerevisiae]|nr:AIF_collapsed_G0031950.mRNA.1.CDS.1 [Saccharomyces cerevisiae]
MVIELNSLVKCIALTPQEPLLWRVRCIIYPITKIIKPEGLKLESTPNSIDLMLRIQLCLRIPM